MTGAASPLRRGPTPFGRFGAPWPGSAPMTSPRIAVTVCCRRSLGHDAGAIDEVVHG